MINILGGNTGTLEGPYPKTVFGARVVSIRSNAWAHSSRVGSRSRRNTLVVNATEILTNEEEGDPDHPGVHLGACRDVSLLRAVCYGRDARPHWDRSRS